MGESAKKWLAGLGAAAVVMAFAAITISKMEHKNALTPANSKAAIKATQPQQTPAQIQTPPPSAVTAQATQPAELKAAEIQNEKVNSSAGRNAAAKAATTPEKTGIKTGSNSGAKATAEVSKAPETSSSAAAVPTQPSPTSAPVTPPDVATPSAQPIQAETKPAAMQVGQREGMMVTGNVNVDGEFSKISRIVYPNNQVLTPGQNGAVVTAKQSAIALGANTQFKPESMNTFALDAGASNVSTKTGMTVNLKGDWRVKPVHPDAATQYEVNYESDGIYVYARVSDVDVISDPCHRSIRVEEGKAIRIPKFKACGVDWLDESGRAGGRTWPYKAAWGTAAAGGTGVVIWLATHQDMSPDHP